MRPQGEVLVAYARVLTDVAGRGSLPLEGILRTGFVLTPEAKLSNVCGRPKPCTLSHPPDCKGSVKVSPG